jgi:hypothetical protein
MSHYELYQNMTGFYPRGPDFNIINDPIKIYITTAYCNPIKWLFDSINSENIEDGVRVNNICLNEEMIKLYYNYELVNYMKCDDSVLTDTDSLLKMYGKETLLALSGDTKKLRQLEDAFPCDIFIESEYLDVLNTPDNLPFVDIENGDGDSVKLALYKEFYGYEQLIETFYGGSDREENEMEISRIVETFYDYGGKIIFYPDQKTNERVVIKPNDFVFSSCHAGDNRSQIMTVALLGAKRQLGCHEDELRVGKPHGAIHGYDPYNGYEVRNDEDIYKYIPTPLLEASDSEWYQHVFPILFGKKKELRIGETTADKNRNIRLDQNLIVDQNQRIREAEYKRVTGARKAQRDDMNKLLFNPANLRSYCGDGGRVIIFAFGRAMEIMVKRFIEVFQENPDRNNNFTNIYIVCLPFNDEIPSAGNTEEVQKFKLVHDNHRHIAEVHKRKYKLNSMQDDKILRLFINQNKHIDIYEKYKKIIAI